MLQADLVHPSEQIEGNPHPFANARAVLVQSAQDALGEEGFLDVSFRHEQRGGGLVELRGVSDLHIALETPEKRSMKEQLVDQTVSREPEPDLFVDARSRRSLPDVKAHFLRW